MTRNRFKEYWIEFWKFRTAPKHRRDEAGFYSEHAVELRLLFEKYHPRTVLELCCGNGALYPYLQFDLAEYKGVDFSRAMLTEFASAHPRAVLEETDATEYQDNQQYDMVLMEFSAGHFTRKMMTRVFEHARSMMHDNSVFVCSSIPWKRARWAFYAGELIPPYRSRLDGALRARGKALLRIPDEIGTWYNPSDIGRLAARVGLNAEFYGCHSYIYRFHATMRVNRKALSRVSSA